jgi:hypothetical protein
MFAVICVTLIATGELVCSAPVPTVIAQALLRAGGPATFASGERMIRVEDGKTSLPFMIGDTSPRWPAAVQAGQPRSGS